MKNYIIAIASIIVLATTFTSCAIAVKTPVPAARVVVKPAAPSPRHIWIADEYVYRGGRYVLVPGYWSMPRGHRANYVPGHWKYTRRGNVWVAGHWR